MGLLETLDASLSGLFGQWNVYSTGLATAIVLLVTYRIMSSQEPDTHPLLLARQSMPSAVRNEGESAVYRSQSAPHGMPLNTGLNVKDPGAPKFSRGRDGDLRDVWQKFVSGAENGDKGRLLTVLGSENVIEHKIDDITRQINVIGRYVREQDSTKVAIYLPNSIELLIALFACSFYPNLTAILIPFDVSSSELVSMLRRSAADTVITATGSFPLDAVVSAYPTLRQLIWVVDQGSRHMDWNDVPEGMGGSVNVTTWQDLLSYSPATFGVHLPAADKEKRPGDVITFWQAKSEKSEDMVRFTQANLAAAISGQLATLPARERLTQSDLFLPADSLTDVYTLTLTLAALYVNASIAFNSVAGQSPNLALATQGISPTVLVAGPASLLRTHQESSHRLGGGLAKLAHSISARSLSEQGVHAKSHLLSAFSASARPALGIPPSKLRLIYVAERAGGDTPLLSTKVLSDVRVFTGARVVYALSASNVAGAVAQTGVYDYRVTSSVNAHFGVPPSCLEIYFKDTPTHKTTDDNIEGEIVARGPCVSLGLACLGVSGKLNDDNTLSYV